VLALTSAHKTLLQSIFAKPRELIFALKSDRVVAKQKRLNFYANRDVITIRLKTS